MRIEGARDLAARGELYPAVILHGGTAEARQGAALELARALLCEAEPERRPCGSCRHCRRIAWPGEADGVFHPDFLVLERDLKTSTSVEATRGLLRTAHVHPFEARGQVFAVASAESLTGEAANAFLKALEEPPAGAARHYLLLAPSKLDLLPTLRSRSLAVYLGAAEPVTGDEVGPLSRAFARSVTAYGESGAAIHLLTAAGALAGAEGWEDPRSGRPWAVAAAAVVEAAFSDEIAADRRRPLLALAEALLEAPSYRLRGISKDRILEGLVARYVGEGR